MIYAKPPKRKKKSRHISNPRITEYIPCDFCGKTSTETHELKGGGYRNTSIKYGFQLKLCKECHDNWHLRMSKEYKNIIRDHKAKERQKALGLTNEQWIDIFK